MTSYLRQLPPELRGLKKPNKARIWLWCVGGFAAFLIIGGLIDSANPKPVGASQNSAAAVCQEFIKPRLKSPTSAKFPHELQRSTHMGEDVYHVAGAVDAQNTYGANLRTPYECAVRRADDGKWHLLDLNLHE